MRKRVGTMPRRCGASPSRPTVRTEPEGVRMALNCRSYRAIPCGAAIVVCALTLGCVHGHRPGSGGFVLREGDLLFQDLDGSPFCDAVEKVTEGYRGANMSHVGIAVRGADGQMAVIEAVSEGVCVTPLAAFLDRSRDAHGSPKVLAGRLKRKHRAAIGPAVARARSLAGKPYDQVFDLENDSYYCSELVYLCFLKAGTSEPLFALQPMTFVDPDTGDLFPLWADYFAELGQPVPQGNPGTNPGAVSRADAVRIVHAYGALSRRQAPRHPRAL